MKKGSDKIVKIVFGIIAVLILVVCVYPIYFVFMASISDPALVGAGKVLLLPKGLTTSAFEFVFQEQKIWIGYRNTVLYTVGSVIFGMIVTMPAAYALSRKDLVGRGIFMKFLVFLMYFNGGLIPTYLIMNQIGLLNTPWVLIMMGSVTVHNIIVARTFFMGNIPDELREAAFLDGCGNVKFFLEVVLPLSKTIIAVTVLYIAVWQWNSYFNAMIYTTSPNLQPLQGVLRELLIQGTAIDISEELDSEMVKKMTEIAYQIKYAIIVVAIVPMLCFYPIIQKYFQKGVLVGSVKG